MKGHIQSDYKDQAIHRLKIIAGQINGLQNMVEEEKYCISILIQSSAIQESLKSFSALMLENHLVTHLAEELAGELKEKAVKEMVRLYKLNG